MFSRRSSQKVKWIAAKSHRFVLQGGDNRVPVELGHVIVTRTYGNCLSAIPLRSGKCYEQLRQIFRWSRTPLAESGKRSATWLLRLLSLRVDITSIERPPFDSRSQVTESGMARNSCVVATRGVTLRVRNNPYQFSMAFVNQFFDLLRLAQPRARDHVHHFIHKNDSSTNRSVSSRFDFGGCRADLQPVARRESVYKAVASPAPAANHRGRQVLVVRLVTAFLSSNWSAPLQETVQRTY